MSRFAQDFRYALATFRRSPSLTIVIVVTLGLGIGANTAIFSVIDRLLLEPLPYRAADRLVQITHHYPSLDGLEASVSAYGFRRYREETRSFDGVSAASGWGATWTGAGEPQRVNGALVSARFFDVFGVQAAEGRLPRADEDRPGSESVVVLSHGFWQRAFGAERAAIGRTMSLDGVPYEVIGVLPPDYVHYWSGSGPQPDVMRPLALSEEQMSAGPTNEWLAVSARVREDVTLDQARAEMAEFAQRMKEELPLPDDWTLHVRSLDELAKDDLRPALLVLLGAVAFVLLIACANVAGLLLARSAERGREMAIRAAMGARRGRLARQLLTESAMLGVAGGALGLVLAVWGLAGLETLIADSLPEGTSFSLNGTVLGVAFLLMLATGVGVGMLPALRASRADLQVALRTGGRGSAGDRSATFARRALVVLEVAVALTLLAGAGLMIKSFARLRDVDPGFRTERLLTFRVVLPQAKYADDAARTRFWDDASRRLGALPGVEAVGAAHLLPFAGGWTTRSFSVEGLDVPDGQPRPWGDARVATPGLARALGIRVLAGRFFDQRDHADAPPVAVVDRVLADRYWPNGEALGRRIAFGDPTAPDVSWITVIGVVDHTKHTGLDDDDRTQIYVPQAQASSNSMMFAVRTAGAPLGAAAAVRQALLEVDPDQPIFDVKAMDTRLDETLGARRASLLLLSVFSALALLLAAVGVYGLISHVVAVQTRELGVRMALGAAAGDVLRLVLRQGAVLAAIGIALGLAGSAALTQFVQSQLFGVDAIDAPTFATTAVLLAIVAITAAALPAIRAARMDPLVALRQE